MSLNGVASGDKSLPKNYDQLSNLILPKPKPDSITGGRIMAVALIGYVITALAALSLNAEDARFVRFEVNGTTSYGEWLETKSINYRGFISMRQNEQA